MKHMLEPDTRTYTQDTIDYAERLGGEPSVVRRTIAVRTLGKCDVGSELIYNKDREWVWAGEIKRVRKYTDNPNYKLSFPHIPGVTYYTEIFAGDDMERILMKFGPVYDVSPWCYLQEECVLMPNGHKHLTSRLVADRKAFDKLLATTERRRKQVAA